MVCRVVTFPQSCLAVSLSRSGLARPGTHRLVLARISPGCGGLYTCQVTAASPPFATAERAGRLRLLRPPPGPPAVRGWRPLLRPGAALSLACTSGPALPAPNISWTFNGDQVRWSNSGCLPVKETKGENKIKQN